MNLYRIIAYCTFFIFSLSLNFTQALAGNEREALLTPFTTSGKIVSAHVKKGKNRKSSQRNRKTGKQLLSVSQKSLQKGAVSKSSVANIPGQLTFQSNNVINHDISVTGNSEFNIGGISLGGTSSTGYNSGSNSTGNQTNGNGTGGFLVENGKRGGQAQNDLNEQNAQSEKLAKLEKAEEMMLLADNTYEGPIKEIPPGTWMKVTSKGDLAKLGLKPEDFQNNLSGFSATLFKNKEGEYVLAFRGTESLPDGITDFNQGIGFSDLQYADAKTLATKLNSALQGKSLSFTGHSLGGGLATLASIVTGRKAVVFNPAALNIATIDDSPSKNPVDTQARVIKNIGYTVGQIGLNAYSSLGDIPAIGQFINDHLGAGTVDNALHSFPNITAYSVDGDPVSQGLLSWTGVTGKYHNLPKQGKGFANHGRVAIYRAIEAKKDELKVKQVASW